MLMRIALDTIAKVGFGVELNCLDGSSKEGAEFMKAFDDSNEMIYWRIVDPFWKLKRFLNIGSEAALKKNIRVIDSFVYNVISTKRELLAMQRDCVSLFSFFYHAKYYFDNIHIPYWCYFQAGICLMLVTDLENFLRGH